MNRIGVLFLGVFAALVISWTGVVLVNQVSYGKLTTIVDEGDGVAVPLALPGIAQQGKLVYQDLGCVACHTQQVRRPGFGIDDKRGWGTRQSVARDYIRESAVALGSVRLGPDLRNVGARKEGAEGREWIIKHLYDPELVSSGSFMPSYRFLFETRHIVGQPSAHAVQGLLPAKYQPPAGYELVLTPRGQALVSYLQSLKDGYAYPESNNVYVPPAPKEGAAKE